MRLLVMIAFALAQWLLSAKQSKLRFLLVPVLVVGLMICAGIYFIQPESASQSVIAENQYFAIYMAQLTCAGIVGCAVGWLLMKWNR